MGTTSSLPEEVLTTKVAKYSFEWRKDFLALRATSKSGLALAQRGLSSCSSSCSCRYVHFRGEADPRHDEAMGRVFGAGCTFLSAVFFSPERIAALDPFVRRTNGGLRTLNLYYTCVTAETLLRMCRASPKLTTLLGPETVAIPDSTMISIGAACPDLHDVKFSQIGRALSPAETWQRHFPGLRDIDLFGGGPRQLYRPTLIDAIRETALTCRHAKHLKVHNCHITADVIEAIVGTPLGGSLEDFGEIDEGTVLEPDAILAAARGFPEFCSLKIPEFSRMPGPGFYKDLSRTTARITSLHIQDETTTDACIAAACSHLRLEYLDIEGFVLLTSGIVDGITRSQSAATLRTLTIREGPTGGVPPLSANDVLRLLQGCPKLNSLNWDVEEYVDRYELEQRGIDHVVCGAIVDLLTSRRATIDDYYFDELDRAWGPIIACGYPALF